MCVVAEKAIANPLPGHWFLYTFSAGRCCLFCSPAPAVKEIQGPQTTGFWTPLAEQQKAQPLPALEVYNQWVSQLWPGEPDFGVVYFNLSHRAQKAKTLICAKVGFPPIPERAPKSAPKAHFWRSFCTKSALFEHFWALFLESAKPHFLRRQSAETPLFAQTNVFAFWALWLKLKYKTLASLLCVF